MQVVIELGSQTTSSKHHKQTAAKYDHWHERHTSLCGREMTRDDGPQDQSHTEDGNRKNVEQHPHRATRNRLVHDPFCSDQSEHDQHESCDSFDPWRSTEKQPPEQDD